MMSAWIIYDKNGLAKCEARQLQYSGEFMGACSINVNISSPIPIKFELGDWLEYRGERFELNYDPSVVKESSSNTYGEGFQYENIVFNSLADELTRCDFLDYVPKDNELHYSSLPTFSFFADSITKLADRIQANLDRVYTDDKKWTVEVHPEYVNTLNVNITASNNTVWDALGFVNSKFGANFIIRGRKITIGTTGLAVGQLFSYGKGNGLYKIERNAESSQKIITRLRAYGSTRNMPTDYYKNVSGGNIPNNMAVKNLMLPSFPVQTHDPYIDSKNIVELGIREGTVFFDGSGDLEEIYPTMEGMTAEGLKELGIAVNATGRLDEVLSAEQISDNGKFEPAEGEEQVTIPDFTITLKDVGFNLNDYLGTSAATISMKDGMCGGRDFEIVSCEKEGDSYILACHRHYDESLDLYFPYNGYQIKGGDKFVLLNIEMPDVYIKAASQRLFNAATAYLEKNDYARYSYTLSVDNIFMARQHKEATTNEGTSIHDVIKEGDLMLFEDEDLGIDGGITISSLSIKEYADELLIPEYEITLQEEKTVGTIEKIQNQITNLVVNGGGGETVINTEQIKSIVQAVGSKLFLSKINDDRSKGKVASDKGFEVGKFVAGASGAIIQVDAKNGQTIAELDKLYVRMKAYFETLEIINVNSVGGKMILSPAGSVTCLGVEELEDSYRCYFLGEQDGEIIENRWKEGMQAYSQMFNAKEGVSNKVSNNYYWRLVTSVSEDVVDFNNQKCHYIDLSKSDCDTNSDTPKAGDVINHRGCRNNADYMNFIEFSSVGTNAPYITLFQGVNSYSLADKEYVSFGYDQSTGRAYMNVYGDMYFGNRDGSSYIKYNPTDGLEVKGKLSVGTTYNGSEIGSLFDKQKEDLEKFTEAVTKEFENIRNEMDGAIDTWFGEETPTLGNYPAVDWITNADKDSHLGDLFYTNDGKAYRFQYTEADGYYWSAIEDSEVVKALELAQKALDTADGKRRVFIEQPYTPYDLGDLWAAGESQPLMRCVNARESGSYYASDWAVADDSHAYTDAVKKDLQASINATKSELDKAIEDAEAAAKDYTDEGKAALQLSINQLNEAKANVNDVYTKAQADSEITKAETEAINAAKEQADAAIKLSEETTKAYADGIVDEEEAARIKQAAENLASAKQYAEEKANEAFNNAMEQIAGYEYLKEALKEDTSIEGGLIQSSLIKLGYTGASGYVVMAGSNGTLDSSLGDKSIAFWAGGDMLDRENGSNVSNAADFLVRMDGSGYAAGGNLSWDINGKITADPMSFFVGEDTVSALLRAFTITYNSSNAPTLITPNAPFGVFNVNGAATFASTLSVNGDITAKSRLLLGDIPMYKSKDGVVYIDGNLVVKGGVTMYGVDSTDIPSLINSLPVASTKEKGVAYFDPNFFSVSSDGKVSFIGETGGGLDITALQNYLTQNSYLNVTEGDNRYLKLSGGTLSREDGIPLAINRTGGNMTSISYRMDGVQVGVLGFDYSDLRVRPNASVNTSTYYRVWHEGNDGANSGLDADLLDGYHRNSFCSLYGGLHIDATSSNNVDLNTLTSADSYYQATSANVVYVTNKPSGVTAAFRLYVANSNGTNSKYLRQRIQQYNSSDIYERVSNNSGSTWTDWTLVQTSLSSFTASSTLDGTLSIKLGSLLANVDNLYAKTTRFFASQWDYGSGTVLDLNEWYTGGIVRCYGNSQNLLNLPDGFTYGNVLSLSNGSKALTGQLAWAVNHNSATDTTKALWFRASDSANGFTYSPWRKIAFADLFLPLTGGTLSGSLFLKNNCKLIGLDTSGGEAYIAYVSQSNNVILGSVFHNAYLSGTTVNIRYGGTSGIYLDSSGNVGVGTTTPAYKLDVNGIIYGDLKMKTPRTIWGQSFDGTSNIKGDIYVINEDATTIAESSGKIKFNSYNATNVDKDKQRSPYIQAIYQSNYGRKRLSVFQSNAANYEDDFVEVFTILPNGNVGIGTSSPSYKLHVAGDIFTSSKVNVNGIEISKSKDDVLYIDANVVVRGGVTMYGTNSTTTPSILNSLPIASTKEKGVAYFDSEFFSVGSDGKVSFIGKTDGFNVTELQNYLTQNSYLNTTQGDDRYLKLSGGTVKGNLTIENNAIFPLRVKNTYSDATNAYLSFYANSVRLASIGGSTDGYLYRYNKENTATYKIWDEGNDGDGSGLDADLLDGKQPSDLNVGSATKLQTARTIWGKSFDGTGNISGNLSLESSKIFWHKDSNSYYIGCPTTSSSAYIEYNGYGGHAFLGGAVSFDNSITLKGTSSTTARIIMSRSSYNYFNYPTDGRLCFGTSNTSASTQLFIDGATGDVGVGTVTPTAKLHVVGNSHLKGTIYVTNTDATTVVENSGKIKFNSLNTDDKYRSPYIQAIHHNNYSRKRLSVFQSNAANYTDDFVEVFTILPNGRVGIGTPSPASLLDVNGDASITGQLNLPTTGSGAFSKPQILLGGGLARIGVASTGFMGIYSKTTIRLSQDSETSVSSTGLWVYTGGFVGINNSAPTHTLDVSGSLHASENAIIDGALNVTGVSTLTGGIATNDIHGNGNALYLGNSGNTSYIYIREDMASSSDSWSIKLGGEATFGSLTSNGALTVGDSATLSSTLTVAGATTLSSTLTGNYWYLNNSASNPYLRLNRASSSSSYWYIQSVSGYISIGGAKSANSVRIDASGNILAAGGITMYSQRSLKNIQDERGLSLDELGTIKPTRYTWKDGRDNRLHIGGIADDIQQVLPEVVYKTNDGVLTMDYGNAAFAIASSLIQPVVDHEKRIAMLEEENKQLRQEVERLKSA